MRRAVFLILMLGAAFSVFALGRVTGTSPVTNTIDVTVLIPLRVGIDLSGTDVTFDLSDASVVYPPTTFPGYYYPTSPAATPYVPLSVFCNNSAGWTLTVQASGDFDVSLPVTQLYYAPTGTAAPADGTASPAAPWTSFSAAAATTVASDTDKTTGWDSYDQDYLLQITGNEDVIDPGTTVTMTYTLTSP